VPAPTSLLAALQSHAAARPEEPWLFYAEGWDWRWLPWGEAARRVIKEMEDPAAGPVSPALSAEAVLRHLARGGALQESLERIALPPLPPLPGTREILVLSGPLEDPTERAMLAWAVVAGAALVIEPDPSARVATAAWARPTLFHGIPAEIARLRQAERDPRGGRRFWRRTPRLPFGRLRTLLVTGAEDLPPDESVWWAGRGVTIHRLLLG
jgi:hypothetical protein